MRAKTIFFGFLALNLLMLGVSAVSVGTAPGVYDLGELDPGKNVAFRFYLMTNSKNDMLVGLRYLPVHQDMYERTETRRYNFVNTEASQEDITSWVEIPRNPLLLSPSNVKIVYLSTGGVVKANEEADIILRIPEDADPGYHAGSISISPQTVAQGRGTGVSTLAVTRFIFVFKVSGEASRKGEIMTIVGDRLEEQKAKVDVLFKNTGTCTLNARVSELRLFDKFGNQVANLQSGISVVRPDLITSLSAYWTGDSVKPGTYRAEATVDYTTGSDSMEAEIEIPTTITVKPSGPSVSIPSMPLCNYLPYLMLLLVIAALVIYLLDWKIKGSAFVVLAALFLVCIILYLFGCVFSVASMQDIFFVIVIIALIIYWRYS